MEVSAPLLLPCGAHTHLQLLPSRGRRAGRASARGFEGHSWTPSDILGLDPGLRNTGWGIITVEGSKLSFVACGVVTSDAELDLALRLKQLHDRLTDVVTTWNRPTRSRWKRPSSTRTRRRP